MRLLFVVQRYGPDVAGGAETACREFATRMAARGHSVEVLTSRARSYVDWADHYDAGAEVDAGVLVRRLSVAHTRTDRFFNPLNSRTAYGSQPVPLALQEHWAATSGPLLPDLVPFLLDEAAAYDAVVFFSYLYYPTWAGLAATGGRCRSVLHPCAHDEPPLRLPLFATTFRHAGAFAFFTEEEERLVRRSFPGVATRSAVVGIGCDTGAAFRDSAFRDSAGLGERPYLLYLGRLDPAKGTEELSAFFARYKQRRPGPLALACVGDPARPLAAHPDVVVTGAVDDALKHSALVGCVALVQPSFQESFSMVLTEAWAHGRPALVQGHCDVLAGRARRAGGGIPYRGYAEFEAALDRLLDDPALAGALGAAGRRHVERHLNWDVVLGGYERLLAVAG